MTWGRPAIAAVPQGEGMMPEIQDILAHCGEEYKSSHNISYEQEKAVNALLKCRTSQLGGHTSVCDDCGNIQVSYNSCRNRHCPKCQTLQKERWIEGRKHDLLNVPYFHVVATIPDNLHGIFLQNQGLCYNLLFKAVSQTLKELAADRKYLGAEIGFSGILHTWGQNLMYHPHIHLIVPGGGLDKLGGWVPSKKKFFLPVKVMSRKLRGKFLALLREAFKSGGLHFYGDIKCLELPGPFGQLLAPLYHKEWIVYCKPPFKTAATVVEYLGRYTHRVAISNNRILGMENDTVSFKWRDYKDNNKWKVMTLGAGEFIRRFLTHVLPQGFMKIRHYGLLCNRGKSIRLDAVKRLTKTPVSEKIIPSTLELVKKMFGENAFNCPFCSSDKISRLSFGKT